MRIEPLERSIDFSLYIAPQIDHNSVIVGKTYGWISPALNKEGGKEISKHVEENQDHPHGDRHLTLEAPEVAAQIDAKFAAANDSSSEEIEIPTCQSDDAAGWG